MSDVKTVRDNLDTLKNLDRLKPPWLLGLSRLSRLSAFFEIKLLDWVYSFELPQERGYIPFIIYLIKKVYNLDTLANPTVHAASSCPGLSWTGSQLWS
jgi:hypothetical protein